MDKPWRDLLGSWKGTLGLWTGPPPPKATPLTGTKCQKIMEGHIAFVVNKACFCENKKDFLFFLQSKATDIALPKPPEWELYVRTCI